MTGVAPITVDSMTSGFNIVTDISLRGRFHNMMGFVESEVVDLLQKIEIPAPQLNATLSNLRQWYDGYRFDAEITEHLYNPEMVLYFANHYQSENKYPPEMLASNVASDYTKVANIFHIGHNEDIALENLKELLETGQITSYLTRKFNIELGFGIADVWSMLFYMGLVTVKESFGNDWTFQMPNYVIQKLYYDYFVQLQLGADYNRLSHIIRASIRKLLYQGDINDFAKCVSQALAKEHSTRDSMGYNEKHLKTLMLGLLFPYESYLIRSEIEHERRFIDIFLERIPQVNIKHEILLELKYIKKESAHKWVDKDGKEVDAPAPPKPVKKVAKTRKNPNPAPVTPVLPAPVPVKPLLEDIAEKGYQQLCEYMALPRFQRPNLLGFCLVFVGTECQKILPYPG
jgi:hypothetical protein